MFRFSTVQLLAAALATFLLVGCGPSEEEARNELREMGIEYNSENFCDAAAAGKDSVVKLFLQGGMAPGVRNDGETPLMAAGGGESDSASAEAVETLLEWGADPDLETDYGTTALHFAARYGNTEVGKILIEGGANVDPEGSDGRTPLWYISDDADGYELVRALLEAGADPDPNEDRRPLIEAAWGGQLKTVEALIEAGADPSMQDDEYGNTALMEAAGSYGDATEEKVRALINAGADVNVQDEDGRTALIEASRRRNEGAVSTLLDAGADVNVQDEDGRTALMVAANQEKKEIVSTLLDAGADPDLQDKNGETALMEAAYREAKGVVTALLDAGADPTIEDNGETAAQETYDDEIESMLKKAIAKQK